MIPAITTKMNGRMYRSLLEAKWATFFHGCGWNFEYEPFETNGWIPDFLIRGKENLLVEIKPFTKLEEFSSQIKKIEKGLWGHPYWDVELLLIGVSPYIGQHDSSNIGWLLENPYETEFCGAEIKDIHPAERKIQSGAALVINEGKMGIASDLMSYRDRITGFYEGNLNSPPFHKVMEIWNECCNKVQWNRIDR